MYPRYGSTEMGLCQPTLCPLFLTFCYLHIFTMHPDGSSDGIRWGQGINIINKLERYSSHIHFLSLCTQHNIIPKGLRVKFAFSGLPHVETLHNAIWQVLKSSEQTIINMCLKTYRAEFEKLRQELEVIQTTADNSMNNDDLSKFYNSLFLKGYQSRLTCNQRKNNKLSALQHSKHLKDHDLGSWTKSCTKHHNLSLLNINNPDSAFVPTSSPDSKLVHTTNSPAVNTFHPLSLAALTMSQTATSTDSAALRPCLTDVHEITSLPTCTITDTTTEIRLHPSTLTAMTTTGIAAVSQAALITIDTTAIKASHPSSLTESPMTHVDSNSTHLSSTTIDTIAVIKSSSSSLLDSGTDSNVLTSHQSHLVASPRLDSFATDITISPNNSSTTTNLQKHHLSDRTVINISKGQTAQNVPQTHQKTEPNNNSSGKTKIKRNRRFKRRYPTTPDSKQVINLSSVDLSEEQIHILSLGPKFCPTPRTVNKLKLLEDTIEGMRKVRLKEFHLKEDTPAQIAQCPRFYKKTYWCPRQGRDKALDSYCAAITTRVKSYQPKHVKHRNINRHSQTAINELKTMVESREIRIIPADKGGAVVIQDFKDYEAEALRQLNDDKTYEKLDSDPTTNIALQSNKYIQELLDKGCINATTFRWGILDVSKVRIHTFYHLPKVHKSLEDPPGRPIVSGIHGPTENLSKLVDSWLQPLVRQLPSFIQDTTHFLRVVEEWKQSFEPLAKEALLVTIDVVGLYTNIPHTEVNTSISAAMDRYDTSDDIPHLPLLQSVIQHILKNNVFQFDDKIYRQTFGTAMGTPMAPSIANIFMAWLEDRILKESAWEIKENTWKRFIDDIVMLWFHGEENLLHFLKWINTLHPTIQFTAQFGTSNIAYLDVNLNIVDRKLTTDLHLKPTDANMCLPFHSCHPRHCTRSIPYSQCLRLRRICSDEETFNKRAHDLQEKLRKRGYPDKLLQSAFDKVASLSRMETLVYKTKSKTDRVPVIINHNPGNPPLADWLKEYMPILHSSCRMKRAVPEPPMVGERNCTNLRKLLMPSRLFKHKPGSIAAPIDNQNQPLVEQEIKTDQTNQDQPHSNKGCYKCNCKRCILCQSHLKESTDFLSATNKSRYTIRDHMTCKSTNLIYLIDCARCGRMQYVGETQQTLQKRFYGHRHNIKHFDPSTVIDPAELRDNERKQDTMVAKHFNEPGHSIIDMRCMAIEQIHVQDSNVRKRREKFWRHQLQTNYPDGLNVLD